MEIEIVRELEEKNIIPFEKINSSVKIFDFNIAQDNIFDYLKCYYDQNKNQFYTTDYYDEIPEIRILQLKIQTLSLMIIKFLLLMDITLTNYLIILI